MRYFLLGFNLFVKFLLLHFFNKLFFLQPTKLPGLRVGIKMLSDNLTHDRYCVCVGRRKKCRRTKTQEFVLSVCTLTLVFRRPYDTGRRCQQIFGFTHGYVNLTICQNWRVARLLNIILFSFFRSFFYQSFSSFLAHLFLSFLFLFSLFLSYVLHSFFFSYVFLSFVPYFLSCIFS